MARLQLISLAISPRVWLTVAIAFALIGGANSTGTAAQADRVCADTTGTRPQAYRDFYAALVSGTNAELVQARSVAGIPLLLPSQVKLVADSAACRAASIAFDSRVQHPNPEIPVIVLELGPTLRVVIKLGTGFSTNMLFDQAFSTLLKTFPL